MSETSPKTHLGSSHLKRQFASKVALVLAVAGFLLAPTRSWAQLGTALDPLNVQSLMNWYTYDWNDTSQWVVDNSVSLDDRSVRSSYTDPGNEVTLEVPVTGPATIAFYWKVDGALNDTGLDFRVDSSSVQHITGSVGWSRVVYTIPDQNTHWISIVYWKVPWAATIGADAGWVDGFVLNGETSAAFNGYTGVPWIHTSGIPWAPDPTVVRDGPTLKVGAIWPGGWSSFSLDYVPGNQTFTWDTMMAAGVNDHTDFWIDGVLRGDVGVFQSSPWTTKSIAMGPGTHTIGWVYWKGSNLPYGADLAWMDKIQLKLPPTIGIFPMDQSANVGSTVTFTVDGGGGPGTTFQWRKNGQNLANGGRISGAGTNSLQLSNVQLTDAGSYSILISNSLGTDSTRGAQLTVVGGQISVGANPANQTVGQGGAVTLSASITGNPTPTLQWLKNGQPISGASASTYTIPAAGTGDAGNYSLSGSNTAGTTNTTAAVLTVVSYTDALDGGNSPLNWALSGVPFGGPNWFVDTTLGDGAVARSPLDLGAARAASIGFTYNASVPGLVRYYWKVSSQAPTLFAPGDLFDTIVNGGTVARISGEVDWEQRDVALPPGAYPVTWTYSTDFTGTAGQNAAFLDRVQLFYGAGFPTQPQNLALAEGTPGSLIAVVSGTGPITLQWQKDGTDVPGATNATLSFASLKPLDAGSYTLLASNIVGVASSQAATVVVYTTPTISQQPTSQKALRGGSATFNVTANGIPSPTFQWKKDGNPVPGATASSLTLNNLTTNDNGGYSVLVSNLAGTTNSASATLEVEYAPSILVSPVAKRIGAGQSASFTVGVDGVPAPALQWRRNGTPIPDGTNLTYNVAAAILGDAGQYDVVVSNVRGSITNSPVALEVVGLPELTAQPSDASRVQGAAVSFVGDAFGGVPMTLSWLKDGSPIQGAGTGTYAIAAVSTNDAGGYAFVASNSFGAVTSRVATLAVQAPVYIVTQPQAATIIQPDNATFSILAGGAPNPAYQWLKNGTPIAGAINPSYSLTAATTNDAGGYSVVVSNTLGAVTSVVASLTVHVKPWILSAPSGFVSVVGSNRQLSVEAAGDAPLSYQWQQNGANVPGATSPTLAFVNGRPSNSGLYKVLVSNASGSVTSAPVTVSFLFPPTLAEVPSSTNSRAGGTVSFSSQALGSPVLAYQWKRNGVELPGANSSTLTIPRIGLKDFGFYTVRVTNLVGSIESGPAFLSPLGNELQVVAWGDSTYGQSRVPSNWTNIVAVSAGAWHTLALTGAGKVLAIGDDSGQQCDVPFNLSNVVAIAAGGTHSLALLGTGAVVGWGDNSVGQSTPPASLSNAVAIAAGLDHSLALTSDGRVVAWGQNDAGQTTVPAGLTDARSVSAGSKSSYALRADGTLLAWGNAPDLGAATNNVAAISAGASHVLLLGNDGTVTARGAGAFNQTSVPSGLAGVVATAGGGEHSLALKSDGTIVAWGAGATNATDSWPDYGQSFVPKNVKAVVAVAAGNEHSVALLETAPRILTQPADQSLAAGADLLLAPAVAGSELIDYRWYQNGTLITDASSLQFARTNASFLDAGDYSFIASNLAGSVTSRVAKVTVTSAPFFAAEPQDITALKGASLTLTGSAYGTAPISLSWRKNGSLIDGAAQTNLVFASLDTADAGDYVLVAQNTYGSATSRVAKVTVVVPPLFATSPQSQTVAVGAGVALTSTVEGTAPLTYAWTKDGAPLGGADGANLNIPSAALSDSGAYQLVASNAYGAATSVVAQITVLAPPTVPTADVTNTYTLPTGQGLTLAVTNGGTGPFTYQWRLDGDPIQTTDSPQLQLDSVAPTASGEYSVVISNGAGSVTVVVGTVTVTGPPVITASPASAIVEAGTNITLTVTAAGEPPLTYAWTKNGNPVPSATGATLSLTSVGVADSGLYVATVSNQSGAVQSDPASLVVAIAPGIAAQPQDQTVDLGQDAQLSVTATGTEPLQYQWYHSGEPVSKATGPVLVLRGVGVAEAGNYTVEVRNVIGAVLSRATTLTVKAPPVIATAPYATLQAIGASLSFGALVYGNEPLTYQWYKDGLALDGATNSDITLPKLSPGDVGDYSILAVNPFGSASNLVVSLRVTGPPIITSQPLNQIVIPGKALTFQVVASGLGDLDYQWIKDGTDIPGATSAELAIPSANVADAGSYRVRVSNAGGSALSQEAVLAFHGLPIILTQPRDTVGYYEETTELFVEASSTLPVSYQWFKNDVPIGGGNTNLLLGTHGEQANDGDIFTVRVSNEVGAVLSKPGRLQLRGKVFTVASAGGNITQSLRLVPGWNSIYLDVQPASNLVEEVFAGLPWSSVWTWRDRGTSVQYIQELSETASSHAQWRVHFETNRTESFNNDLVRIFAQQPYLVHIDGTNDVTLDVVGAPEYRPLTWVPDSYNLVGLPIDFGDVFAGEFFASSTAHHDATGAQLNKIYELSPEGNWGLVPATGRLRRNTAYWVYCRGGSSFNGPLDIKLGSGTGLNFGERVDRLELELNNQGADNVVVRMSPFGDSTAWPLSLKYMNFQGVKYSSIPVPYELSLAANSKLTLVTVPERARVDDGGFAAVMRVTDLRGTMHLLPVSITRSEAAAAAASLQGGGNRRSRGAGLQDPGQSPYAGLWVGTITLKSVSELNGIITVTNNITVTNDLGQVTNIVSFSYTNNPLTPAPTPVDAELDLRLLVHVDKTGQARLLKEVFQLWQDGTRTNDSNGNSLLATAGKYVLVTDRSLLASFKGSATRDGEQVGRRLSSATFVFDGQAAANNYVPFDGSFEPGGRMTTSFTLTPSAALNPFRHKYHPDHDNLDATFKVYKAEAYSITREVTIRFDALPPGNDPSALANEMAGAYSERVTGLHRKAVATSGDFRLRRISPIDELNPAPAQ